jgi:hypothetical protein
MDVFLDLFLLFSNIKFIGHFNDILCVSLISIPSQTIAAENFTSH